MEGPVFIIQLIIIIAFHPDIFLVLKKRILASVFIRF
jgi:hypothetical protein